MKKEVFEVLSKKFSSKIVESVVVNGKIFRSNFYGENLKELCLKQIETYIDNDVISSKTNTLVINTGKNNWGFDFPGWLGDINNGKRIMIIGQEPNIQEPPIQVVYNFCENNTEFSLKTSENLVLQGKNAEINNEPKSGYKKIWYRISQLLMNKEYSAAEVLENCYITDICHFAPSFCGTVKSINGIIQGDQKWEDIRMKVLEGTLRDEILAISPRIIICQSNIAYQVVVKTLQAEKIVDKQMSYPKNGYKIKLSKWENIAIIGVPHMGSNFNITNKFWRDYLYEVKEHLNTLNLTY